MTVGELGERMSLRELCVLWPAYDDYKRREANRRYEKMKDEQRRRR